MVDVGVFLASGGTSDIYRLGNDAVVKIPRIGVPAHWARFEADLTAAVHKTGLPVPSARDIVRIGARDCVVLDYVEGPSMWERMQDDGASVVPLARLLASIQTDIRATIAPVGVPDLHDRLLAKINDVPHLSAAGRADAEAMLGELPRERTLYHGDLHPGNVLMTPDGPVVIDWFDTAAGSGTADMVRTSLLIRPSGDPAAVTPHLPGATVRTLRLAHETFLANTLGNVNADAAELAAWEALQALARRSERAQQDDSGLRDLWDGRRTTSPTRLSARLAPHSVSSA